MEGRICLVTGANRGIGKATAAGLAKMGANVVMVCRHREQGELARTEIRAESGNPAVDLLVADLASQASIRQLAVEFKSRYQQLHVLINNAGVAKKGRTLTEDGLETTFDFDNLQGEQQYDMDKAYNQSKLANVLFTYELARRLEGTEVTVNSLEPGMVVTDFGREYTGLKAFMNRLWRVFMKNPERGAETSIYLASSPEVAGISGRHFVDKQAVSSSKSTYDAVLAGRLWDVSETLTRI
jgi:NAD(P)-dependent dehydrogenase (short-subunit alcohol dehydrogenase family)